jgi:hypothetical protein
MIQAGGMYSVTVWLVNLSQGSNLVSIGISDGGTNSVIASATLAPINQPGSSVTLAGIIRLPATSNGTLRLYANCQGTCKVNDNGVTLYPTRSRVTTKTLLDGQGNSYPFAYRYDEPAMNDAFHSVAVSTTTETTRYYPAYSEFRGHARVEEVGPDGRVTATWYHQDDALKGLPPSPR